MTQTPTPRREPRQKMPPLIRRSGLSSHWYLVTRYRIDGSSIVASTKYDVTDQMEHHIAEARAALLSELEEAVAALRTPSGRSSASYDVMTRAGAFDDVIQLIHDKQGRPEEER